MPCLNNFFGSHTLREFDEILDEDDFASNSEVSLATHQSIKAYVDNEIGNVGGGGGGSGGGGGDNIENASQSGTPNTGGGGGADGIASGTGASAGGSGIVIIRYLS